MDTNELTQEERENIVRDALENLHEVYLDCARRQTDAQRAVVDAERATGVTRQQLQVKDWSHKP